MTLDRFFSFIWVIFLLLLLVSIRYFEVPLFNDPLNDYFHSNFQVKNIPQLEKWKVILGTSLRYLFNMVISLWLLWFLFKKESYIKAALWVYFFAFVLLILAFAFSLDADTNFMKMTLFYIRRFLIHPILLFVLVAGFYFLKTRDKELS